LFHYLQKANWEKTFDAELSSQSLEEYAQSSKAEHNWMTRILVNKMTEEVSLYDLELAKLILNKKCIVGLFSDLQTSLNRFEMYFERKWKDKAGNNANTCKLKYLKNGINVNSHPLYNKYSKAWSILQKNNDLDMQLYDHVLILLTTRTFL